MGRLSRNAAGELARLLRWGTAAGEGDDRLLERFVAHRDESAFAALVDRHGPMVLGVCRRVLRDEHDVEDAFQATFLILARNARTIRRNDRVGPWLHGVARRVAVRAKVNATRRLARERTGIDAEPSRDAPSSRNAERIELRAILDEELSGLPERLRAPLVLCYLEGLTHDQAASRLSQPVGTIRSRLSRGRERLRDRLARRGVRADDAALGSVVAIESVSPALLESTIHSALEFAASQSGASALASAGAVALAQGVLKTMMISKLSLTTACALGLVLTAGGLSGYAFQQDAGADAAKESPKDDSNPLSAVKSQLDAIQRSMSELEGQRREHDEKLSSIVKRLDALRKQLEQTSGQSKPVPDQPAAADGKGRPRYLPTDRPAVIPSEDGRVVTLFPLPWRSPVPEGERGEEIRKAQIKAQAPKSVRLAEAGNPRLEVLPLFYRRSGNNFVIALGLRGEKVQRLAVFDSGIEIRGDGLGFGRNMISSTQAAWIVQDLSQPVKEATPVVGRELDMLAYVLDNRIYTYRFSSGKWDVLELPEGARPEALEQGFNGLVLEYEGIIYSYNMPTGEWIKIDTRSTPDNGGSEE